MSYLYQQNDFLFGVHLYVVVTVLTFIDINTLVYLVLCMPLTRCVITREHQ